MPLELVVSRLAGGQRPRSFWHSRLCFYEPLWIKEHTVYMSPEAPWCGLLESRLNGLETAQGLPQPQGLIAFDLPVRLPLRAISQQPGQALEELPSKLQALSEERPGFLPAEYPQVPYDLGSSQSLGRGRLSPYQVPKRSLASQRGRSLYTLLCRFWSTHGFCVLSSLECIPAFVAYLAQGSSRDGTRKEKGPETRGLCIPTICPGFLQPSLNVIFGFQFIIVISFRTTSYVYMWGFSCLPSVFSFLSHSLLLLLINFNLFIFLQTAYLSCPWVLALSILLLSVLALWVYLCCRR